MAASNSKVNVWPGYVAAMACLLQSLVLVCGVMALTILVMTANKTFSKGGASKPSPTASDSKSAPVASAAPNASNTGNADSNSSVLRVKFLKEDWNIDPRSEKAIKSYLAQFSGKTGDGKRVVWINIGGSDDPQKARLAYLRVLQVRNLIEQSGAAKSRFEYRIMNSATPASASDVLYISAKGDLAR